MLSRAHGCGSRLPACHVSFDAGYHACLKGCCEVWCCINKSLPRKQKRKDSRLGDTPCELAVCCLACCAQDMRSGGFSTAHQWFLSTPGSFTSGKPEMLLNSYLLHLSVLAIAMHGCRAAPGHSYTVLPQYLWAAPAGLWSVAQASKCLQLTIAMPCTENVTNIDCMSCFLQSSTRSCLLVSHAQLCELLALLHANCRLRGVL